MADNNVFMGPKYNSIIDDDPQFIRVPLETIDIGARKSGMPKGIDNAQTIKHVGEGK